MKSKPIFISVICMLLSFAGGDNYIHIDRGRIEDTWTMTIVEEHEYNPSRNPDKAKLISKTDLPKPIIIRHNTFFNLDELGLKENPDDHRKYYGRIAFAEALKVASAMAVTSYYKISFSPERFSECIGGKVSYYGEYYLAHTNHQTWTLWISDTPII